MPSKFAILPGFLLLAGCVTMNDEKMPAAEPPPAVTSASELTVQSSAAKTLPYPERPPEPPKPETAAPEIITAARTPAGPDPAEEANKQVGAAVAEIIIGESEAGIKALFGPPRDVRPKFPGHVWNYTSDVCAMDIFFYLDIASDTYRVLTLDITPETETENCYGSLANAKG